MKKLLFVFGLLLALAGGLFLVRPSVQNVSADHDVKYCHPENGGKYPFTLSDNNSSGSFVYSGDCVKGHGSSAEDDYKQCISDWCVSNNPVSDQCLNISGIQSTVPAGDYQNNDKECFPKTQVCADDSAINYGGTDGIFNPATEVANHDLCVYSQKDVCANIDGVQSTVPDGDYQSEGNCLPKTHVCTDPEATNYDSNVDATEVADSSVCTYAGVTPTPTNTPSNGGGSNDGGDGLGCATHDCSGNHVGGGSSSSSQPIQAVLGASTMAGTGTFENTVMDFMLVAGIVVLALGAKKYAKESK
ncbi:MAG TPA: hypothetical protein VLB73_02565 [Patescibacteria group bacterium]|nr:hypothetical protein [Patescibacteria group bacterium]